MAEPDADGIIIVPGAVDDSNQSTSGDTGAALSGDNSAALADGTIIVEPRTVGDGAATGDDTPRKRRGRPKGSTNGTRKKTGPTLNITGLEKLLYSAHGMLASITKVSELELDESEATQLAVAIGDVGRHYDMALSAKALDWSNLMMALGTIYGTRLMAIRMRRTMERQNGINNTVSRAAGVDPRQPFSPASPVDPGGVILN